MSLITVRMHSKERTYGGRNMEYTPMEKDVLDMMQRTDFKNISKGDVISFASKIGELRPEVAKEVLA